MNNLVEKSPNETLDFQSFTILIVDDEPANLGVLVNYLADYGFQVMVARDGVMGLRLAREAQPDLILLDVLMPGVDGFETCRRLKADEQIREIPVIFMTIVTNLEDKVKGFTVGGVDYITKPFQYEEVLARVATHLRLQDLTCRLREAKEQAEAASQAKSAFLANMSHELRTPLNAILGYAQILQRRPLEPDVIEALNTVQRSGEHLLTLINDILDIARIEAGKLKLSPAPIHFLHFLDHIASIVRTRAEAKGLTFGFEALDTLPVWVEADETRLRQVLLNLLDNAVKFTDEGRVTWCVATISNTQSPALRAGASDPIVRLSAHDKVSNIRFEVQDTGIGIPPDQLERIFQPFEQVEDVTSPVKGTGLGLAISRQLVRLMGGELHVQSEPDRGSTFWFEVALPVTEVGRDAAWPLERGIIGYKGPRRTVLVVDDVPSNRAVLVDLLAPLGFDVIEAADGQQALHLARELRPDLILMDRWMPVLNGFEATRRMRQIPELARAPIIAISASVLEQDQAQSREAGIHAFLPKPVNWASLAALLEEYLGIEWEYEEETETRDREETAAVLLPPPQEELVILLDLARRGNMCAIRDRADYLEQADEKLGPFVVNLRQLVKDFEDEAILTLIRRYMEGDR